MKTKPMVMLLTMLAGWMNRQQQEIIEYLIAENGIHRLSNLEPPAQISYEVGGPIRQL